MTTTNGKDRVSDLVTQDELALDLARVRGLIQLQVNRLTRVEENLQTHLRALEGSVVQCIERVSERLDKVDERLDVTVSDGAVVDVSGNPETAVVSKDDAIDAACFLYDVSRSDVLSTRRTPAVCSARRMIWHWLQSQGLTLGECGVALGRDHTTVLHGLRSLRRDVDAAAASPAAISTWARKGREGRR